MTESKSTPPKLSLSIDLRLICLALLLVVVAMLAVWRPWSQNDASDRSVAVTGESTIKAEPDSYQFYPSYEFKNSQATVALAESIKKTEEVTTELQKLGVSEKDIKTATNGAADFKPQPIDSSTGELFYNVSITITTNSRDTAQKIQDYLVTTLPLGPVSPQASFSDSKRKEVEGQARSEAIKDARKKADQTAVEIGFKIGKIKSVSDGQGFADQSLDNSSELTRDSSPSSYAGLPVQPGQNELRYSVSVVYYVN